MELKLEEVTHVLKAYKFYLAQITHCAFDGATVQWIIDNWDADYDAVENKGSRQGVTVSGERISSGYYKKPEVDDVLAEKDKEIAELQDTNVIIANNAVRLNNEIAELKAKLDSMTQQFSKYVVDAQNRERKLKRAFYKACVNWMTNRQHAMRCYNLEARAKKFDKAIAKCIAMAEEYK